MARLKPLVALLLALCILFPAQVTHSFDWSRVRVVSLYESITDTSTSTLISVLRATHTDFVFRAYFRGFQRDLNTTDYDRLVYQISAIKAALPGIQVMGGISCSVVYYPGDYWPDGRLISQTESRQMFWILPNGHMAEDPAYRWPVLDITKPLARQFIEAYAFKLIDAGVDSILFDEVNIVPESASHYGLSISDVPYIAAWEQIMSSVKAYAMREYGKGLFVTLNTGYVNKVGGPPPEIWPYQDFITVGINPDTIRTGSITDDWSGLKAQVTGVYGRVLPIMAFIDWGPGEAPLSIFASLSQARQISMLKLLYNTAANQSFYLVYPVRGGAINGLLSYTGYNNNTYDAVKEGTFNTIVQLSEISSSSTQTSGTHQNSPTPTFPPATFGLAVLGIVAAAAFLWFNVIEPKRKKLRIMQT
jgi:hypothetical protein